MRTALLDRMRIAGRAVYHAAPARFWHRIEGLKQDLLSLPARLSNPTSRREPWQTFHHVGGDYRQAGEIAARILLEHGQLVSNDDVLDIGCGNGRVVWPLLDLIGPDGGYVGFDVSGRAILYCQKSFGRLRPDFQFHHLDIFNGVYNPGGAIAETAVQFPCGNETVSLAFATSVLTHLPWPAIQHYFDEVRRVLKPGGRALLTAFVLTPQVRAWAREGLTSIPLRPYGDTAMTADPHWPENAMAYDETAFRGAAAGAGLIVEAVLAGQWRPEPQYAGGQDLLILRRAQASE